MDEMQHVKDAIVAKILQRKYHKEEWAQPQYVWYCSTKISATIYFILGHQEALASI